MTDQPQCPSSPRPTHPPTPPTPPRRKIAIKSPSWSQNHVNQAIAQANARLSHFKPASALELYTDILTNHSHPCAFLNRSLCYILLGYSSLAVIDAYRALLAAHWAKTSEVPNNLQARQLLFYGRFVLDADELRHEWINEPSCYVGVGLFGWLSKPLASLAVKPQIRAKKKAHIVHGKEFGKMLVAMANDAILKAYYRLALALWKCGGGALKSALDVLCDAQSLPYCTSDDAMQFEQLQNRILLDIEDVMNEEAENKRYCNATHSLNEDTETLRFYEEYGIRGLLKTRFTKITRELYPWDKYSLSEDNLHHVLSELNEMVEEHTQGCRLGVVREMGKAPKLGLYAKDHLFAPAQLFNEMSCFHVTSSGWDHRHPLPCDSCASSLDVSRSLFRRATNTAKEIEKCEDDNARENRSPASSEDSDVTESSSDYFDASEYLTTPTQQKASRGLQRVGSNDGNDTYTLSQSAVNSSFPSRLPPTPPIQTSSPVSQPPKSSDSTLPGFQLCPKCCVVAFCSSRCHLQAICSYHKPTCTHGLENHLRTSVLPDTWKDVPKPMTQCLLNLLFLRILANACTSSQHPLEKSWIRFLDGDLDVARPLPPDWQGDDDDVQVLWWEEKTVGLDVLFPDINSLARLARSPSDSNPYSTNDADAKTADAASKNRDKSKTMIPWSFDQNVRQPLHCLYVMGGPDLALDVRRFDGWVLETMRAKIEMAMRVTRFPRFEKAFDEAGRVVAVACGDSEGRGEDEQDEEAAWVASLHPLASLVRVAGDEDVVNVKLCERDGAVACRTFEGGDAGDAMDVDVDVDSEHQRSISIRAGEPLLRGPHVAPWVMDGDGGVGAFREMVVGKRTGETMVDAEVTEWGWGEFGEGGEDADRPEDVGSDGSENEHIEGERGCEDVEMQMEMDVGGRWT
ncbi:hypothetical protein K432DRAFT_221186 [Lepidopterella palustris CBS 459.81]|uniref:Uncharacterized protein n=1 Tax=Lepidopterella palustris CBS 459.81 TaxID=1314670 RepID=A0A8E2EER4_9PEZI|nr:hypothetical protein K432DRAFT_221186 [Lepidopterella palustris CBS 459.81]